MGGVNCTLANSNNWIETAHLVLCIATQIIEFRSHIEDFQKTLYLKKKFVLTTDYCITLDRIPEEFYPEIAQNTAQLEAWKDLFAIHETDSPSLARGHSVVSSASDKAGSPSRTLAVKQADSPLLAGRVFLQTLKSNAKKVFLQGGVDFLETFNYLLGLKVKTRQCLYDNDRRYFGYRGTIGQKIVVIIWRATQGWKQLDWERAYRFIQEKERIKDADEVYINTDSIVPKRNP